METWYLGYCLRSPDGERPGAILPLAGLERSSKDRFVEDTTVDVASVFEPTGRVFWPQSPPADHISSGCLVRFLACESSESQSVGSDRDRMRVYRSDSYNSKWECERIKYRIVRSETDADWQSETRSVLGLSEGDHCFVQYRCKSKNGSPESRLAGPWRVGKQCDELEMRRELIPHPTPRDVRSYPIGKLPPDSIFSKTVKLPGSFVQTRFELLLYIPDESISEPLDLYTTAQLSKWLIEQIVNRAPAIINRIDAEAPGWRKPILKDVSERVDSSRKLIEKRWEKVDSILDDMVLDAERVEELLQHPKFLERFNAAVAERRDQAILEKAAEIEAEAKKVADDELGRLEGELDQLEDRRSALAEEVEGLQALRSKLDRRELQLETMEKHLDESRGRLILDAMALLPLRVAAVETVPHTNGHLVNGDGNHSSPRPARISPAVEGPPVESPEDFVNTRLWPALWAWTSGTRKIEAKVLHAAVGGCRATLIPDPTWAKAFAEACGGTARLDVVNVEPTWLGFSDLWRGGFGDCWKGALEQPDRITLILLRDFNRALPQCYARPLLDLIAGFVDELPAPDRGGWPKNLRLLACPSPSNEALPTTIEVSRHFGAVQKQPPAEDLKVQPPTLKPGHLSVAAWLKWCERPQTAESHGGWKKDFGPLARAAAIEVSSVEALLRLLGESKGTATDVRIFDAKSYADELAATTKGGR